MNKEIKEKIYKILTVILWIIFIISVGYILIYCIAEAFDEMSMQELNNEKYIENILLDNSFENIVNTYKLNENKEIENVVDKNILEVEKEILVIKKLKEKYSNLVGWIKISGTNIDYPIMQADDNDYYLKKNYKGEYNMNGSIFLDYRTEYGNSNYNQLIYGHNNQNDKMFENLLDYENKEFYKENPYIEITTDKEKNIYEIFAVFKSKVYEKNEDVSFKYYNVIDLSTEELFCEYINNCKNKSLYEINILPEFGDCIITLSTCEYSNEEGRFVVVARLKK